MGKDLNTIDTFIIAYEIPNMQTISNLRKMKYNSEFSSERPRKVLDTLRLV